MVEVVVLEFRRQNINLHNIFASTSVTANEKNFKKYFSFPFLFSIIIELPSITSIITQCSLCFQHSPLPLTRSKPSVFCAQCILLHLPLASFFSSSCDIENQLYKRDFRYEKKRMKCSYTENENTSVLCSQIQSSENYELKWRSYIKHQYAEKIEETSTQSKSRKSVSREKFYEEKGKRGFVVSALLCATMRQKIWIAWHKMKDFHWIWNTEFPSKLKQKIYEAFLLKLKEEIILFSIIKLHSNHSVSCNDFQIN